MKNPLVSIIIPSFNRANFLSETLDSVIAQEYKKWECIVVDDGSDDGHLKEIRKTVQKDPRIKLICRPLERKKGGNTCRNIGIENSKGTFIQFLDSDDLLHPEKIKDQIEAVKPEEPYILYTGRWGGFNRSSNIYQLFKSNYHSYRDFEKPVELLDIFGEHNEYFPPHVYLTPVELIKKAGPWNEELHNNQDGEFFSRVILNASGIKFCRDSIAFYRHTSESKVSHINSTEKIHSSIKSWKLIHSHIKSKEPAHDKIVKSAATRLYAVAKKNFPEVLDDYSSFFKLRNRRNVLLQVFNYTRRKTKRLFPSH